VLNKVERIRLEVSSIPTHLRVDACIHVSKRLRATGIPSLSNARTTQRARTYKKTVKHPNPKVVDIQPDFFAMPLDLVAAPGGIGAHFRHAPSRKARTTCVSSA